MEAPMQGSVELGESEAQLGGLFNSKEYRSCGDAGVLNVLNEHRVAIQQDLRSSYFESASQGRVDEVEHVLGSSRASGILCLPSITRVHFFQQKARFQRAVAAATELAIQDTDVRVHSVETGAVECKDCTPQEKSQSPSGWEDATEEHSDWNQEHCVFVAFSIFPSQQIPASSLTEVLDSGAFLRAVFQHLNKTAGASHEFSRLSEGSSVEESKQREGHARTEWFGWFEDRMRVVRLPVDARDSSGATAMHWAAVNDHFRLLPTLLREGADINAGDKDGQTPLHWASLKGRTRATAALCEAGAGVDVQDRWGFTALMRAAQGGHVISLLVLLRGGAGTSLVDHEGHTVLQWAVFKREHAEVEWLLGEASVRRTLDMQDENGATALHLACRYSGWEMARKLLAAGARADMVSKENLTPQEAARKHRRAVAYSMLWWYGRVPAGVQRVMVRRGRYNRAFEVLPTCHCFWAMVLIALGVGYYLAVLLPGTAGPEWGLVWVVHVIFVLNVVPMAVSFWNAWKGDPGIIPPQPEAVINGVLSEELSESEVMLVAMCPKVPRAKYSRFFRCYVARFDHDCPWISNVVGAGNHHWFFLFVLTVSVCLACWTLVSYLYVTGTSYAHAADLCAGSLANASQSLVGHAGGGGGSGAPDSAFDPRTACPLMGKNIVQYAAANHAVTAALGVNYLLFLFFTAIMVVCQAQQIAQNVTTNELINSSRYEGWERADGGWQNPYDRGVVRNCAEFCRCYPAHAPAAHPASPLAGSRSARRSQEMVSLLPAGSGAADESSEGDGSFSHRKHGPIACEDPDSGFAGAAPDDDAAVLLSAAHSRRRTAVLEDPGSAA